jgi:hypothetical protein
MAPRQHREREEAIDQRAGVFGNDKETQAEEDGIKSTSADQAKIKTIQSVVLQGFPMTSADTLPPKLWPLSRTFRTRAGRERFGT